ncbi:MAG: transglutaminase-like domain-containing protein [Planctomycetota bacterium]
MPAATARAEPGPADWWRDGPVYALYYVALAAFGVASEAWEVALPLAAVVAVHPLVGDRLSFRPGMVVYLLLSLPFAGLSRVHEVTGQTGLSVLGFTDNVAFYAALYYLFLTLVRLYGPRDERRIPRALLATGILMTVTGVGSREDPFVLATAAWAAVAFLALRAQLRLRPRDGGERGPRPLHAAAVGITFALAAIFTVAGVETLEAYHNDITRFFGRMFWRHRLPAAAGFDETAALQRITDLRLGGEANRIALSVFADAPPGLLRGKAYQTYGDGQWHAFDRLGEMRVDKGERGRERFGIYVLEGRPVPLEGAEATLEAFPARAYRAHFFLPLGAAAVVTRSDHITVFPGRTLQSRRSGTDRGYRVHVDPTPVRIEGMLPAYRHVPPDDAQLLARLDATLRELGLAPGAPARDAVRRLQAFFASEFTYDTQVTFAERDAGGDYVGQFLRTVRRGHCELFASAGTLLLRRLGLSARYVTGFVCEEENAYGGLYVARDRHAHAWCEVYDPALGWTTAEFTVAPGLPDTDGDGGGASAYARARLAWLSSYGLSGLFDFLLEQAAGVGQWFLAAWWRTAAVVILLAVYFWRRLRRRTGGVAYRDGRDFPADLAALRAEVLALEARLRRLGLGRQSNETLREYAARLDAAPADPERFPDRERAVALVRRLADQRYAPFDPVAASAGPDPGRSG